MSKKVANSKIDPNKLAQYIYLKENAKVWAKHQKNIEEEEKRRKGKDYELEPKINPFILSTVKSKDDKKMKVKIKENTGAEREISYEDTIEFMCENDINVPDLAAVPQINEMDLLNNLVNRLEKGQTFTNVGPTVIIFNPYKRIEGIYGLHQVQKYIEKQKKDPPDKRESIDEPHLYDLVLIAIQNLKRDLKDQALLISGESGAGKSVATVNAMNCVTDYFNMGEQNDSSSSSLSQQILCCSDILEAFGNAKTVRNDNSSRFGKYVKLFLDTSNSKIIGANMIGYLLEKSRVTQINPNERNYHVFYFLLSCGDNELLSKLHLEPNPQKYEYLKSPGTQVFTVKTVNDVQRFKEMDEGFTKNNFTPEEKMVIYKIVAAVLLLGQVTFKKKSDTEVEIVNEKDFNFVCELLGYNPKELIGPLTRDYAGGIERSIKDDLDLKKRRDAFAKEYFNKLFFWIIEKLNKNLEPKESKGNYIGLLDIFGFECFDENYLEQLCINYTNEVLQQLYIYDVFEGDKKIFRAQGLEDKLHLLEASYKDNKDLIGTIEYFCNRLKDFDKSNSKNPIYDEIKDIKKKLQNTKDYKYITDITFTVKVNPIDSFFVDHTAKKVKYNINGFIERNRDAISATLKKKIVESSDDYVKMIFLLLTDKSKLEEEINAVKESRGVNENLKYISTKFVIDMRNLKNELERCVRHYVRCIKPNEVKSPTERWPNFIFNQIEYLGILSSIKVRKQGFPVRKKYADFFNQFKLVLGIKKKDIRDDNEFYKSKTEEIINILVKDIKFDKDIDSLRVYGNDTVFMKDIFLSKLCISLSNFLKEKISATYIIRTVVMYLPVILKVDKRKRSTENVQSFFNGAKTQIKLKKKKQNILKLQSVYYTLKEHSIFNQLKLNFNLIENSLLMYKSKININNSKIKMKFLTLRLLIYTANLKKRIKQKFKKNVENLIFNDIIVNKIVKYEKKNIWNKIRPYFLIKVCQNKKKDIIKIAKKSTNEKKIKNTLYALQINLLFLKIEKKYKLVRNIYKNSISNTLKKIMIKYMQKSIIIQKYIQTFNNKKEGYKHINDYYLKKHFPNNIKKNIEYKSLPEEDKNIFISLFPNSREPPEEQANNVYQNTGTVQLSQASRNNRYDVLYTLTNNKSVTSSNKNKLLTQIFSTNSNLKNVNNKKIVAPIPQLKENANNKNKKLTNLKIYIFAYVVDFDIIDPSFAKETYEIPWNEEYLKLFKLNMNVKYPIQLIYTSDTHTVLLNSHEHAFSFGWNNNGQCGQKILETTLECVSDKKQEILKCYKKASKPIDNRTMGHLKKIVCGDNYTLMLNNQGKIFGIGDNTYGQLGVGHNKNTVIFQRHIPQKINKGGISNFEIKNIYSNRNSNIAISTDNSIFFWSTLPNVKFSYPKKIYMEIKLKISQISCGMNFYIFLTESGTLFGCGSNVHGELCMKNNNLDTITPKEITEINKLNEKIVQIRCGFKHSVCLSSTGRCFTWGNNGFGQLGTPNKCNSYHEITHPDYGNIIQVGAGYRATMIMNDDCQIFYFGILGPNSKNVEGKVQLFQFLYKVPEIHDYTLFYPLRLMSSWNMEFSIFYVTFADLRDFSSESGNKSKFLLLAKKLSLIWKNENLKAPYDEELFPYLTEKYMYKK